MLSLVIATYNRRNLLRRCLQAAIEQDYPDYEVIVVDDASTDGSDALIAQEFPNVRYLRQQRNHGPAAARNRGIAQAHGEIVAFTDDDCIVPRDYLTRLADGYRRYPQAAGVGGYQEAAERVLKTRLLARYERFLNQHFYHIGDSEYLGGFECPAGGTNSMSYRRAVLLAVGGFDQSFPLAAGEDAYLKWQITQRGHQLLFVPLKVTHLQSYELQGFWRQQVARGRGAAHFERLQSGKSPGPPRILLRLIKRSLSFLLLTLQAGPQLAAIFSLAGWADAYGQYLYWWRQRQVLSQERQVMPTLLPTETPATLDIGCGQAKTPGAVGMDINPASHADILADVNLRPWPFADNSFDRVVGKHVIEHVTDMVGFFEELHRVCRPGARVELVTPHFTNRYSYTDPTHLRHLAWRSFDYFSGESLAPIPTFFERVLEVRHAIPSFYTQARFRVLHRFIDFGRPHRLLGIQRLANAWPDAYEQYLGFSLPARDLYALLEVVK